MLDKETFARAVAERPTFALLPYFEDGTFDFMPDEAYLPFHYNALTGNTLDLEHPVTFNDKIAWLKVHDRNPLYQQLVDKLAVREFVATYVGDGWLVPLLGVWNTPEEVDFDALPERFALKCTHSQGGVVVCRDKAALDRKAAIARLRTAYDRDFFSPAREWAYKDPTPRVIAEAFVDDGGEVPADYKFFCMNGKVRLVCVSRAVGAAHEGQGSISFFWPDGERAPFKRADYPDFPSDLVFPAAYDEMYAAAEVLSHATGAPFVRVDLYCASERPFFSEFTFYPCGGTIFFDPPEFDRVVGDLLDLPTQIERGA